jgi:flagellar assembly factor FliW
MEMLIQTTRFGMLDVDSSRIIHFAEGLLGFAGHHRFALIQTTQDAAFYWMQSVEDPAVAFVVCDPFLFVSDYQVPVRSDEVSELELNGIDDCQILTIVNRVGDQLTGNLLGPLVVGATSMKGKQMVLSDKRYSTRQPLMRVPQPLAMTA